MIERDVYDEYILLDSAFIKNNSKCKIRFSMDGTILHFAFPEYIVIFWRMSHKNVWYLRTSDNLYLDYGLELLVESLDEEDKKIILFNLDLFL